MRTRSATPKKKDTVPASSCSPPPVPCAEDPFAINMGDFVSEIARRQKLVDRTELGGADIMEAYDVSKDHFNRRDRIMSGFLRCLGEECKF